MQTRNVYPNIFSNIDNLSYLNLLRNANTRKTGITALFPISLKKRMLWVLTRNILMERSEKYHHFFSTENHIQLVTSQQKHPLLVLIKSVSLNNTPNEHHKDIFRNKKER